MELKSIYVCGGSKDQGFNMHFTKLDDSPMFRKQIQTLEENAESLRERSLKFYKGCRKYTEGLGEGYDGDIAFASSLEMFGGGHNDPISVAFGGPVMTKFTIALREIGTYKEVLRSQVEHMLNDRLLQFVNIDLHDVKEARKRFDKASLLYDQAREKYLSLRKGTKADVAAILEEELYNARSSFEQARFNLVGIYCSWIPQVGIFNCLQVTALSNVEAKKRFEFLEAVSGTMDAHLRYFKQVLAYAQQSRERSNYEQAALTERMQEYKRQIDRESRWGSNGLHGSPNGDGIQAIGRSSHKMIEAVMQSASKGKVQTIRQGYLSKRSSNLRGDWKRRFFVLDSRGMLYYYRKQSSRPSAESAMDQMDWIEKITGVIASLLSSQSPEQRFPTSPTSSGHHRAASESSSFGSSSDLDHPVIEEYTSERNFVTGHLDRSARNSQQHRFSARHEKPIEVLRRVIGNDVCADCGAPEPDWASLNLGVLVCIECSGVHRNLGVHISKVRSLTLDVKVWEPSVINLFQSLGNTFANSIWEELLHSTSLRKVEDVSASVCKLDRKQPILLSKPSHTEPISIKEKFIQAKYAEKAFVRRPKADLLLFVAQRMWASVRNNDKKSVYHHIVASDADVNVVYGQAAFNSSLTLAKAMLLQEQPSPVFDRSLSSGDSLQKTSATSSMNLLSTSGDRADFDECLEGCSLLHLACQTADVGMIELLLQYGANINAPDSRGQTPLHHCILRGRSMFAKLLLTRGADPQATDQDGKPPLQYATETGNLNDEEILLLLENR
ncbi:ADP-ribosylation factor GTPase-activating protein AGD3 [Acorus gramineus]|uniref:ADP-ribosylation factor GTPase-activating protein AGD3 n=1 Tax=Acorus gramineus TaxID=55184 RepID=A0AAV9B1Z5_ACOGR|nr:ADP-ribosylation factor GTPase-activating protein AGD3 [Acorus gramineus]